MDIFNSYVKLPEGKACAELGVDALTVIWWAVILGILPSAPAAGA